jgi:hypothetical protein
MGPAILFGPHFSFGRFQVSGVRKKRTEELGIEEFRDLGIIRLRIADFKCTKHETRNFEP